MSHRHPSTRRTRVSIACVFAVASCVLVACGRESPEQTALDSARITWSQTAHAHYRMTTQRMCVCVPAYTEPIVVEVVDEAITSAVYEASGDPVPADVLAELRTVSGLFGVIQDALDRDADLVQASYDPELGYPVQIFIDYDEGLADEEFALVVRNFTVLP